MDVNDIHAAVIVGGGSLIPKIQEQLLAKLKLEELTRNMDAFESAALGAGFYAAGLSPSFRVREVGVTDLYPFGVSATVGKSDADAEGVAQVVFEPKEPVPNRKYLVFSRDSNFTVDLKYTNPEVMSSDTEAQIGSYNLTGVNKCEKYNTTDKPKMSLMLEIDKNGMATVTEASAGVSEWTEKSVKIPRKSKKTEDEPPKKSKKDRKKKSSKMKKDADDESEEKDPDAETTDEDVADEVVEEPVVEEPVVVEEHKCEWNATINVTLGEGEEAKEKEVGPYVSLNSGHNKTMKAECSSINPEFEGDVELLCFVSTHGNPDHSLISRDAL